MLTDFGISSSLYSGRVIFVYESMSCLVIILLRKKKFLLKGTFHNGAQYVALNRLYTQKIEQITKDGKFEFFGGVMMVVNIWTLDKTSSRCMAYKIFGKISFK